MSKTNVFVQAKNGLFYSHPIIFDNEAYVCFDDEDDPELVLHHVLGRTKEQALPLAMEKLISLGIDGRIIPSTYARSGSRLFPPDWKKASKACRIFFEILAPIPVPEHHSGVVESTPSESVTYYWFLNFETKTIVEYLTDENHDKYFTSFMMRQPHYMLVDKEKSIKAIKREILNQYPQLEGKSLEEAIALLGTELRMKPK